MGNMGPLMERMAVIDMGSNSFRLVVFQYEPRSWWSLADEIREATRVSAGMGEEGVLQPEPMDRAVHTAAVFASLPARPRASSDVDAVATSAIRDAANRDELLAEIRERTGLEVRVISGAEEAWYGYLAIANSHHARRRLRHRHRRRQRAAHADRRAAGCAEAESVPLGAVRVSEAFLPGEDADARSRSRRCASTWRARCRSSSGGTAASRLRLAGIGGTIRNLAAAAQKRLEVTDLDVQGFVLTREALGELIERAGLDSPAAKRGSVRGIKPDRGDVILGGAVVAGRGDGAGRLRRDRGHRGRPARGHLLRAPARGPGPAAARRRAARVGENLAHRYRTDDEHVDHVAQLSLQMFDALGEAGLHDLGADERELLWAACMLHDIGVAIDYDDHHRHSHYLILNAGLPGFDRRASWS